MDLKCTYKTGEQAKLSVSAINATSPVLIIIRRAGAK